MWMWMWFRKCAWVGLNKINIHIHLEMVWNQLGPDFSQQSRLALEPTQPRVRWVPGHFPWGKMTRAWRWSTNKPPASVKVKCVKMYIYYSGSIHCGLLYKLLYIVYSLNITCFGTNFGSFSMSAYNFID